MKVIKNIERIRLAKPEEFKTDLELYEYPKALNVPTKGFRTPAKMELLEEKRQFMFAHEPSGIVFNIFFFDCVYF